MNRLSFVVVGCLCVLSFGATPAEETASEIEWTERPAAAFKEAAAEGKPILVDMWAVWCQPCKVMEKTTFRDPEVLDVVSGFIPLKVNVDQATVFVRRYEADAFPTTLFLDHEGREITRLISLIDAPTMSWYMQRVLDGYEAYAATLDRKGDPDAARSAAAYLKSVGNAARAVDLLQSAAKKLKKSAPEQLAVVELELSETLIAAEQPAAACKILNRLAESIDDDAQLGRVLVALAAAETARGNADKAEAVQQRLRQDHPEFASAGLPAADAE